MDAVIASPRTLLSLERFRALVGIQPAAYWGAAGSAYFPEVNASGDIFYQFYWQSENNVSREEIASAIKEAEDDITRVLGYSPAPVWTEEVANYPHHYRRDVYEWNVGNKSVQLGQGKFIQGGQRASTLLAAGVTVTRTDTDSDGFKETATITTPTTLTDACEIKCYFAGESGNPDWEVRTPRSVTISGGNVTFKFWSWQLLDPELQQQLKVLGQIEPINVEADASYVTTVDVYREYNDFTETSAQFLWKYAGGLPGFCCTTCGGSGCIACELVSQDGCIHVADADGVFVVPVPASYSDDDAQWQYSTTLTVCRNPDLVKLWYYAGDLSQEFLAGRTCEPLSNFWAETIAWLAVARVNRPFCTANNSQTLLNSLQRDMSFTGSRQEGSFVVSQADLDNPFGQRAGEIKAWKRVSRLTSSLMMGAAV